MTARLGVFLVLGVSLTPGAIATSLTNEYQLVGTLNEGRSMIFTFTSDGFGSSGTSFQDRVILPLTVTFPKVPHGITDYLAGIRVEYFIKSWTLTCNPPCDQQSGGLYHPAMVQFTLPDGKNWIAPPPWVDFSSNIAGNTYDLTFDVTLDVIEFFYPEGNLFGTWAFKGPSTYDIRVMPFIEFAAPPIALPEPSSFVLMGLAIAGAGFLRHQTQG